MDLALSCPSDLLDDLPFLLPTTPAFVHPLLPGKFLQKFERAEQIGLGQRRKEAQMADEDEQQFADPLNATSSATLQQQQPATTTQSTKENGLLISKKAAISSDGIILTADRLDNTLAERLQEQWPLEGLDPELVGLRPWRVLRTRILQTFAGNAADRVSLESTFLRPPPPSDEAVETRNGGRAQQQRQRRKAQQQQLREKRHILKEQPGVTPTTKFHDLSQEEWVRKLFELRRILMAKWREEQRLECIKLVTEVAALISTNIGSAQFYPAQFVHVTDLLDLFGHLVYERLLARAREERRAAGLSPLPAHFDINDVLEDTRLKARNWFGKVNEMVKLLAPRIYLLAALLPCQRFMDPPGAVTENVLELCRAIKLVQHPLISCYLRCYICRVAMRLNSADRAPHWKCLNDWLQTYTQQPTSLLGPAMEWIVQCVAYNAHSYADLHPLWEYCRLPERRPVVLIPMLNALPRLYLAEHALEACRIVTGSEMVSGEELCALGANLLEAEPPVHARKPILKAAWKCVMRTASLKHFVQCCECWAEFVARHFSAHELDVVLDTLIRRLQNDKHELYQPQLLSILARVFTHSPDAGALFAMDVFPRLLDLFRTSAASREHSAMLILRAVVTRHASGAFTDIDLAYQILSVCASLHDCVEPGAVPDRSRVSLICSALDRVDLFLAPNPDPDQCLAFLVQCRADLSGIDALQQYVLRRVQALTLHIVRSVRYTTARAAFLQGCLANQFISIPSLMDPFVRIQFAIQSTQIALAAFAFLQIDAFLVFILNTFADLCSDSGDDGSAPDHFSGPILRHGTDFLATLAQITPQMQHDDGEKEEGEEEDEGGGNGGLLRHFRRFLHFVLGFPWPSSPAAHLDRVRLLIHCLHYLFVVWSLGDDLGTPGNERGSDGDDQLRAQLEQLGLEGEKRNGDTVARRFRTNCTEFAEQIALALEPDLLDDEGNSDALCPVGVELLELVALFGPDDATEGQQGLPRALHSLAKAVYKRNKRRRGAIGARIQRLQQNTTK